MCFADDASSPVHSSDLRFSEFIPGVTVNYFYDRYIMGDQANENYSFMPGSMVVFLKALPALRGRRESCSFLTGLSFSWPVISQICDPGWKIFRSRVVAYERFIFWIFWRISENGIHFWPVIITASFQVSFRFLSGLLRNSERNLKELWENAGRNMTVICFLGGPEIRKKSFVGYDPTTKPGFKTTSYLWCRRKVLGRIAYKRWGRLFAIY